MREGYQPPFPAWKAQLPELRDRVVMAYFGVQARTALPASALREVTQRFALDHGPQHWDLATAVDDKGFHNLVAIAYWPSAPEFAAWKQTSRFAQWWDALQPAEQGYFLEVVTPDTSGVETIFSDRETREGVAWLADGMGDETLEHGYWGSARERMQAARTSALVGEPGESDWETARNRIVISGRSNLCLIRSGQDWADTHGAEREKYLHEVEPVLRAGMDFLRDNGESVGCLSCRYMTVLDRETLAPVDKTFGLAHFVDMACLEGWAKSHPTHVAIFQGFMRYVKELDMNIALRLWHEIVVVPAGCQQFEYINCHSTTGLLRTISGSVPHADSMAKGSQSRGGAASMS